MDQMWRLLPHNLWFLHLRLWQAWAKIYARFLCQKNFIIDFSSQNLLTTCFPTSPGRIRRSGRSCTGPAWWVFPENSWFICNPINFCTGFNFVQKRCSFDTALRGPVLYSFDSQTGVRSTEAEHAAKAKCLQQCSQWISDTCLSSWIRNEMQFVDVHIYLSGYVTSVSPYLSRKVKFNCLKCRAGQSKLLVLLQAR